MANMAKSSLPIIMASPGYSAVAVHYDPFAPIETVSASPASSYYRTWDLRPSASEKKTPEPEPEPLHGLIIKLLAACAGHTTAAASPASSPTSSEEDDDDDYMRPIPRVRTRRNGDVDLGKDWGRRSVLSVNEISADAAARADTDGTLYQTLESRQMARKDLFLAAMSCRELGTIHEDALEE